MHAVNSVAAPTRRPATTRIQEGKGGGGEGDIHQPEATLAQANVVVVVDAVCGDLPVPRHHAELSRLVPHHLLPPQRDATHAVERHLVLFSLLAPGTPHGGVARGRAEPLLG